MNEYSIYWIKEEVAKSYFHKSDILSRFLREYEAEPDRNDLKTQYLYITRQVRFKEILAHLNKNQAKHITVHSVGKMIYINQNDHSILLQVEGGLLNFRCKNLQEAVMLLFPMLRDFHPFLFVQGKNVPNYGWISPIIQKTSAQVRQVLYSYR
ncbi:sporulation inhibitor of replication protein SirA [Oceanobacillus damuensis]|uniref:sporulation inhibitor of replication protein SirA n=1 Tax=Oceanobacillus damuensis TaxID=937928 RepID=UPI00082EB48E|nr:sporulation inhibitor of replication protein SirA [Oceanobacillus damuensis]